MISDRVASFVIPIFGGGVLLAFAIALRNRVKATPRLHGEEWSMTYGAPIKIVGILSGSFLLLLAGGPISDSIETHRPIGALWAVYVAVFALGGLWLIQEALSVRILLTPSSISWSSFGLPSRSIAWSQITSLTWNRSFAWTVIRRPSGCPIRVNAFLDGEQDFVLKLRATLPQALVEPYLMSRGWPRHAP